MDTQQILRENALLKEQLLLKDEQLFLIEKQLVLKDEQILLKEEQLLRKNERILYLERSCLAAVQKRNCPTTMRRNYPCLTLSRERLPWNKNPWC